jgi:hypothetical protein
MIRWKCSQCNNEVTEFEKLDKVEIVKPTCENVFLNLKPRLDILEKKIETLEWTLRLEKNRGEALEHRIKILEVKTDARADKDRV